jgi:ATP-dependent helicase HrpA
VRREGWLEFAFEWSQAEAQREWVQAAPYLARLVLGAHARDLTKRLASQTSLLLAAGPYLTSDELIDLLLQWVFRRACFADRDPPRSRTLFDAAVERGRERLHSAADDISASALKWFTEARAARRLFDDPRARAHSEAARESHEHLRRLLNAHSLAGLSADGLRQVPRHVKAEERRWERLLARGSEPQAVGQGIQTWSARLESIETQLAAEHRWIPQLDDLRLWIEEYRVSLYAQELKTLGPVSAARLTARAAEIEAWLTR